MIFFSYLNDAITGQMYADGYNGEGTAAIVPIIQNKLNTITVCDLTNVSYSLGVLVEIYESGTSTLITSNGPYNTGSPQHIVFPIDFSIRPTVTNVDIRIIGGPGTISPSAPP